MIIPRIYLDDFTRESADELNSGRYMLGVTGTMGSGKSFACQRLVEAGADIDLNVYHVELDKARVEILSADPRYLGIRQSLADRFGNQILNSDTSVDRELLRERLFGDSSVGQGVFQFFRDVTHSAFREYIERQKQGNYGLFLVEWALLCQQGFAAEVDHNFLIVQCSYKKQLERLYAKSDLTLSQLEEGIKAQGSISKERTAIRRLYESNGKGRLFTLNTTNNPNEKSFAKLMDKIWRNIR